MQKMNAFLKQAVQAVFLSIQLVISLVLIDQALAQVTEWEPIVKVYVERR